MQFLDENAARESRDAKGIDRKRYSIDDSVYKRSFLRCLRVVYQNEIDIFSNHEVACLTHFMFNLSDHGRYLFARLFMRSQKRWFKESDYIQYEQDCDVNSAVGNLFNTYQYTLEESDFEISNTGPTIYEESFLIRFDPEDSLQDTLNLLSLSELKTISTNMKSGRFASSTHNCNSKSSGKTKNDYVKELMKLANQASVASFFKSNHVQDLTDTKSKILSLVNDLIGRNVIRLNPFVHKTISRAFLVFFRGRDFESNYVESALLVEMGVMNFPHYKVKRTKKFFNSRAELLAFEEAMDLRYETDSSIADRASERKSTRANQIFQKLQEKLVPSLQAASFYEDSTEVDNSIHFTPEWICVRASLLWCNGMLGNPQAEWRFLDLFLKQRVYHKSQRGKAYIRKALLEMNQLNKNFDFAFEVSGFPSDTKEDFKQSLIVEYYKHNPSLKLSKKKKLTKIVEQGSNTTTTIETSAEEDLLNNATKLYWNRIGLQTCIHGLEDSVVHEVYHLDLKKRIIRLEKQLRIPFSSKHDFSHIMLKQAEHRTIQCERLYAEENEPHIEYPNYNFKKGLGKEKLSTIISKNVGLKRPMWVDIEGVKDSVNVEEASLSYYKTLGWEGMHSENSMLATLFSILFWDILWANIKDPDTENLLPGIFEHHCQAFPLDLFSSLFYLRRKKAIDERLEKIKTDMDFVKNMIQDIHTAEVPRRTVCLGVSWYSLEALHCISEGIGCSALATICELLAKNYRVLKSGMPDLCLYKIDTKECMFSEVKSEFDTLSDKQCYWIDILVNAGVKVEVCHVLEPKSYFKKVKLSK